MLIWPRVQGCWPAWVWGVATFFYFIVQPLMLQPGCADHAPPTDPNGSTCLLRDRRRAMRPPCLVGPT